MKNPTFAQMFFTLSLILSVGFFYGCVLEGMVGTAIFFGLCVVKDVVILVSIRGLDD